MSISTKTGDDGQTGLYSGERIDKDSQRVEAYGTIDELNSFIGEVKHYVCHDVKIILEDIQNDLFHIAAELASVSKAYSHPISQKEVDKITATIYHYEDILQLKGFVILGSILVSGKLDICRAVSRRAERRILSLAKNEHVDSNLKKYMNRLSDLIFIIARYEEHLSGKISYH
jgi:ATP:cob(I)alamin adenosyltransferase